MKYILVQNEKESAPMEWRPSALSKAVCEATGGLCVSLPLVAPSHDIELPGITIRQAQVEVKPEAQVEVKPEAKEDPEALAAAAALELKWKREAMLVDFALALVEVVEKLGLELSKESQAAIDAFKKPGE